jgi:hypothetical protein
MVHQDTKIRASNFSVVFVMVVSCALLNKIKMVSLKKCYPDIQGVSSGGVVNILRGGSVDCFE